MVHLTVAADSQKLSLWIERIQECMASNQKVSDWWTAHADGRKSYYYWICKNKREAFDAILAEKDKVSTVTSQPSMFAKVPHTTANFAHQPLSSSDLEIGNPDLYLYVIYVLHKLVLWQNMPVLTTAGRQTYNLGRRPLRYEKIDKPGKRRKGNG